MTLKWLLREEFGQKVQKYVSKSILTVVNEFIEAKLDEIVCLNVKIGQKYPIFWPKPPKILKNGHFWAKIPDFACGRTP